MAGELFNDVGRKIPGYRFDVLLDVGANTGQTTATFLNACPAAKIRAFEPVTESYERLLAEYGDRPNVFCHRLALAREDGEATVSASGTRTDNRIVTGPLPANAPTETVITQRGDAFCRRSGVDHVGLLKIDTEGFDLDVLVGVQGLLAGRRIDFVQVEAGMNTTNRRHVPLSSFVGFLGALGYELFRIYDQAFELDGRPLLRRANPVFISTELVARVHRKK